ncbi:Cytochrome P450 71C4 [Hordeum vulgare]|nr:Cytochrome P450 71C4 [Hordeum vulgare]
MLLQLGAVPTLIVSSPRAAEAVLRTHDHVFASRPHSVVADIMMYGMLDVGFAPYGEYWRQTRKLVTTHLLSVKKVQSFRSACEEEVSIAMAKINEAVATGSTVDMSELLSSFTNDIACRAISGKFFRKEGRNKLFQDLINDSTQLLGGFILEEYFPVLAKVCVLKWFVCAKAERMKNRWADLLEKVIDDHDCKDNVMSNHKEGGDFIDVLLSVQQEYDLTKEHILAMLTDIFFGATSTSCQTLDFALVELVKRPHMMTRLQDEVRSNSLHRREGSFSKLNQNNMIYLKAVIKESLRLHPVAPLLSPHLAMADCCIDGYTVPTGTQIFVNAWAIGRDTSSWEEAEEFMPERFLDDGSAAHVNFMGNDFQFLPFGAGRRMCPGINFAIDSIEIMLATLMYYFDWELPQGLEPKDIDMTEVFGLTVRRREKLLLVPKLSSELHGLDIAPS